MYERYIKVVAVAGTICLLFWGFEYSQHQNWRTSIDDCMQQVMETHPSGSFSHDPIIEKIKIRDRCEDELGYRSDDLLFVATSLAWLIAIVFGISLVVRYIRVGKFIS